MKLKAIALTAMLMGAGAAFAAPTLQRCAPMEVTHSGASGLSYSLVCDAGGWNLKYTGSVPSGTDAVTAHYRVKVSNPDGSNFSQSRSVRLPSPAMLGQALIREAVLLDNGDIALRDCSDFGCTLYRPLGNAEKLAKATITVTPEVKRLSDESARLQAELLQRKDEISRQSAVVVELQGEVQRLTQKVTETEQALIAAKEAHDAALASVKDQYAADVSGLMASEAAELAKSLQARELEHGATVTALKEQLTRAEGELAQARNELALAKDVQQSSKADKAAAEVQVGLHATRIAQLQADLAAAQAELKRANEGFASQMASLQSKEATQSEGQANALAAGQAELVATRAQVVALTGQVDALQKSLGEAKATLQAANATQAAHASVAGDVQAELRARVQELAEAQLKLSASQAKTAALTTQVAELQQSLKKAQSGLVAAQEARAKRASARAVKGAQLGQPIASQEDALVKLQTERSALSHMLAKAEAKLEEQARLNKEAQALSNQASEAHAKASESMKAQLDLGAKEVAQLKLKVDALERSLASANADLAAQKAQADAHTQGQATAAHEAQLADVQAELVLVQSALDAARAAHQKEVASLNDKLSAAQAGPAPSSSGAQADVARLQGEVEKLTAQVEKLAVERQEALLLGKQVAEDMLEMLDGVELIEKAKADAEKALEATNNRLMELSAKLEASQLARELAMQAATTAHADADAQNIRNQELAQRLARAEEALKVSLENGKSASAAQAEIAQTSLEGLEKDLRVEKERNNLLESKVSAQEQELLALRQQLAALRGELPPAEPIPGPAPDEQK